MYTLNVWNLLQTCKNWEKKLITATAQNRIHIPSICFLCSFTSRMANVCRCKDHTSHLHFNTLHQLVKQNINPPQAMGAREPSPQEFGWTGQHRWDWRSHWEQLPASPAACRAILVGCTWGCVLGRQALHVLLLRPHISVKEYALELFHFHCL